MSSLTAHGLFCHLCLLTLNSPLTSYPKMHGQRSLGKFPEPDLCTELAGLYKERLYLSSLSECLSLSHTHTHTHTHTHSLSLTPLHFPQLHSFLLLLPQETGLEGKIRQDRCLVHSHLPVLKSSTLSGRKKRGEKKPRQPALQTGSGLVYTQNLSRGKKNNFPRANKLRKNTESACTPKIFDFQDWHGGPVGTASSVIYTMKTNTLTLQTRCVVSSC